MLRLVGVVAGVKIVRSIYRVEENDVESTFSRYWRGNARGALYAVGALALVYYVLEGGSINLSGIGVVAASLLLIVFITGETVLAHRDETYDAIDGLPGPFIVKILAATTLFLSAICVGIYYLAYAIRSD